VIHSTKDGPAVHEVKDGSCLEGRIYPGDLIIAVDDVDTRAFTAAQLMKTMAEKSQSDRKITVLHFEEKDEAEKTEE
jgi:C-terminal processing protease CtpA/Prc